VSIEAYYLPKSVDEATNILADQGPDLLLLAGGTLAMPLINEGISMPEKVLGLKKIGLNYMNKGNGDYTIGATTTLTQMVSQDEIPILKEAARAVGGWAIRNMGTVGGNLFAPPPGGDFAVALLALDADIVLVSTQGERVVPISEFYTGFMTNVLLPGEIVTELRIATPRGHTSYEKFGRRGANTPSIVTVAAKLVIEDNLVQESRLALNGVGPHPLRAMKAEEFLVGNRLDLENIQKAAEIAVDECEPFTDPIASEWFRQKMIPVIIKRCLEKIIR
jgi:CO/xanthine dehydrogenase FAD-binding subunit